MVPDYPISFERFLELEEAGEARHHYVRRRMIPVGCDPEHFDPAVDRAGESFVHCTIGASLCALIGTALKRTPFETFSSGLRLGTPATGDSFYVDLSVFDGTPVLDRRDPHSLTYLGPMLLAEVVSPRTNVLDRVWKFDAFRTLNTVREFLFVFEDRPEVHTVSKADENVWLFRTVAGLDAEVPLQSVGITLPLTEVYDRVSFGPPAVEVAAPPAPATGG